MSNSNFFLARKKIQSVFTYLQDLRKRKSNIDSYNKFFFKNLKKKKILKVFKFFSEKTYKRQIKLRNLEMNKSKKLLGVPIGIKDIFNTYDMPTGMGSKILKNYQPGNDARIVSNLRLEGAIIMGKTQTSEFAVHNPPETKNPKNIEYSPGTSSSGSAAAVAAGIMPLAIGSQTAGSICRPASFCGVYGFKPSFGVIPRTGVLKTSDTLDTIGILGRFVEDLEIIFDVIKVQGHNYPFVSKFLSKEKKLSREVKIAIFNGPATDKIEKSIQKNFLKALSEIKKSFKLINYNAPKIFNKAHDMHELIYNKSLSYYFKNEWKEKKKEFSNILNRMIVKGNKINLNQYKKSLKFQENLSELLDSEFKKFDFLICPTTSDIAPKLNKNTNKIDHCLIFTLTGNPMISIPILKGKNSMPVGILLIGKKYDDYNLLKIAKKLDNIFFDEII